MDRLGPYQLIDLLGEGGMAKVYLARDPRLERTVAIKVLHGAILATRKGRERFQREARLAAALRHPNILTIYDCSAEEAAECYLVTELIGGGALRGYVGRRMLAEEVALLLLPVARALGAAHEHGIIHRDVKPDNILVERSAGTTVIKLADFGVALCAADPRLTTDGAISGSVMYMAPEQLQEGLSTFASDVWSWGVTFLELLEEKALFSDLSLGQIVAQIVAGRLQQRIDTRLAGEHDRLPPALSALLHRCLRLDPAQRWPQGTALVGALEQALAAGGIEHPEQELARWDGGDAYRSELAARLADQLVLQAARACSLSEKANLLDRALFLVPHHAAALALLQKVQPSPSAAESPPATDSAVDPHHGPAQKNGVLRTARKKWALLTVSLLAFVLLAGLLGLFLWTRRLTPALPQSPSFAARPGTFADAAPLSSPPLADQSSTAEAHASSSPAPALTARDFRAPSRPAPPPSLSPPRRSPSGQGQISPGRKPRRDAVAKKGVLMITSEPWAEIVIDGETLGYTPKISRVELAAGKHHLVLRNPLCRLKTAEITLVAQEIVVRHFKLELLPARLKIDAPAGWSVYVDGALVGQAPIPPLNLTHGAHRVRVISPSGRALERSVQGVAGQTMEVDLMHSPQK